MKKLVEKCVEKSVEKWWKSVIRNRQYHVIQKENLSLSTPRNALSVRPSVRYKENTWSTGLQRTKTDLYSSFMKTTITMGRRWDFPWGWLASTMTAWTGRWRRGSTLPTLGDNFWWTGGVSWEEWGSRGRDIGGGEQISKLNYQDGGAPAQLSVTRGVILMQTWRPRPLGQGVVLRELMSYLVWCQKDGEETRQEEARGDGGEKGGTIIFGGFLWYCTSWSLSLSWRESDSSLIFSAVLLFMSVLDKESISKVLANKCWDKLFKPLNAVEDKLEIYYDYFW